MKEISMEEKAKNKLSKIEYVSEMLVALQSGRQLRVYA